MLAVNDASDDLDDGFDVVSREDLGAAFAECEGEDVGDFDGALSGWDACVS